MEVLELIPQEQPELLRVAILYFHQSPQQVAVAVALDPLTVDRVLGLYMQ